MNDKEDNNNSTKEQPIVKKTLTLSLNKKINQEELQKKAMNNLMNKDSNTAKNKTNTMSFVNTSVNEENWSFPKTEPITKDTSHINEEKTIKEPDYNQINSKNSHNFEKKSAKKENNHSEKEISEVEEIIEEKHDHQKNKKIKTESDDDFLYNENIRLSNFEEAEDDENYIKMYGGGIKILDENSSNFRIPDAQSGRRKSKYNRKRNDSQSGLEVEIYDRISIIELARNMKISEQNILKKIKAFGFDFTLDSEISIEDAEMIVEELGHKPKKKNTEKLFNQLERNIILLNSKSTQKTRNPVVTILGHVDHGKTTLVEKIKGSNLTDQESGGITQKVSCYQVKTESDKKITFVDTPGHALFSSSRQRGVNITDIIVIVIAADDGIMPQTAESIEFALKSKCEIIIAINKIDKAPNNVEKIKQDLLRFNIMSEDMGGNVMVIPVSAIQNKNIDLLIRAIEDQAEMLELKACYEGPAIGYVIDSVMTQNSGSYSNVVVKEGSLKVGDVVLTEKTYGKVRKINNHSVDSKAEICYPSDIAEIFSFNEIPASGSKFIVCKDESIAARSIKEFQENISEKNNKTLEEIKNAFFKKPEEEAVFLNLYLKADAHGSLEALENLVNKDNKYQKVKLKIISKSIGQTLESDVKNAKNTNSVIIIFGSELNHKVKQFAEKNNVRIIMNNIIYKIEDELIALMRSSTKRIITETLVAKINIKKIFVLSNKDIIIGGVSVKGGFNKQDTVKIIKDENEDKPLHISGIDEIRIEKDKKNSITQNQECGIKLTNQCQFELDPNIHKIYVYEKKSIQEELI